MRRGSRDSQGPGNRGDWNRGNGNRGDWSRGDWNRNPGSGGKSDWSRGNWNRGDWNRGDWARNDWNRRGWNPWNNNWNNNNWWWGGNRGWNGYGRNWWVGPGWNNWGWGWGWGVPVVGWNLGGWGLWGLGWGLGNGAWGGYYPAYYDTYNIVYPTTTYYADAGDALAQSTSQAAGAPLATTGAATGDFVADGEAAFRAGRYQEAFRAWQHSMVDDPDNGAVVLLMGQALFALGQYDAAANMVQMGMQMLPETEWGNVVANYLQLYGNVEDYTNQIRAAEKVRDTQTDDGAVRFLLGYHFGYLNYPKQAVRELDAALTIEPRDVGAEKLRDIFATRGGFPARPHTAQQPDAGQPTGGTPVPASPRLGPDQPAGTPPPAVGTEA